MTNLEETIKAKELKYYNKEYIVSDYNNHDAFIPVFENDMLVRFKPVNPDDLNDAEHLFSEFLKYTDNETEMHKDDYIDAVEEVLIYNPY